MNYTVNQITSLESDNRRTADSALSPIDLQTQHTGNTAPEDGSQTSKQDQKMTNADSTHSRHLDRGWAWVVMAAAMMTHIMSFGLIYAMVGIFHVELLAEFGRSDSDTAWTGSILLGTMLCSGN